MPNAFAYLMLLGSPLLAVVLFKKLALERALVWTIIAGYLLLPSGTYVKFPMIPAIDRALVPAVSALVLCLLMGPKKPAANDPTGLPGRLLLFSLFLLVVVTPVITVMSNTEPIIDGRVFLPGLRLYDAWGLISVILVSLIPLWLGIRYLSTPLGHRALIEAVAIGGLFYSLLALAEVRLSPQMHHWVYGFSPQDFVQHMRNGGYRPAVFLNHGLMLGIFFCMSVIAAAVLYKEARREGRPAFGWLAATLWLLVVLYLSKTLGALSIAVPMTMIVLIFGPRLQVAICVGVALVVLFYPMLRGAGWIPVETAYNMAKTVSDERAASLKFRLDNEDALLAKANLKPVAGWGSWGRNALYDPENGAMTSITDGIWLIFIGVYGWLGYIGRFGLLTVPTILYALRRKSFGPSLITPGLVVILSATLIDLLPNAWLENYNWLMAGAIAGMVAWRPAASQQQVLASGTEPTSGQVRAEWLMSKDATPATGRQKRPSSRHQAG